MDLDLETLAYWSGKNKEKIAEELKELGYSEEEIQTIIDKLKDLTQEFINLAFFWIYNYFFVFKQKLEVNKIIEFIKNLKEDKDIEDYEELSPEHFGKDI